MLDVTRNSKFLLVSSIGRGRETEVASSVRSLDLKTGEVIDHVLLTGEHSKYNVTSKGGSRGARGMVVIRDLLYVASYKKIHEYKIQPTGGLCLIRIIEFPVIIRNRDLDIHKIYLCPTSGKKLYIVTTGEDAVWLYDLEYGSWLNVYSFSHLRKHSKSRGSSSDDFLHINSLSEDSYGHVGSLVLFNNPGIIYNVHSGEIVLNDHPNLGGSHDLWWENSTTILTLDSKSSRVLRIDLSYGTISCIYKFDPSTISSGESNMAGWLRGLCLKAGILYVGCSPGRVLCLKYFGNTCEFIQEYQSTTDSTDSPFDVKVI